MPFTATVYRILIGGPSDAENERKIAADAVYGWNHDHSAENHIILLPIMWEIDSRPQYGDHPQSLLNRQMVHNCDAMIAIFRSRLGTPTEKYLSGTIEELETLNSVGKEVMVYLYQGPIAQDIATSNEYSGYRDFALSLQSTSLYSGFSDDSDFKNKLSSHISKLAHHFQRAYTTQRADSIEQQEESPLPEKSAEGELSEKRKWWELLLTENELVEVDVGEVRQSFEKEQSSIEDRDERVKNEALFFNLLITNGNIEYLSNLETLSQDSSLDCDIQSTVLVQLSQAYAFLGSNHLAREAAQKAVKLAADEKTRTSAILSVSWILHREHETEGAVSQLHELANLTESRMLRNQIFATLAIFYGEANDPLARILALELALENTPEDISTRFEIARQYDELGLPHMTLRHYDRLLRASPKHHVARNNLGVTFSELGAEDLAILCYQRALEQDYALSAANIAHLYLAAGFLSDAEHAIAKAKESGGHPRALTAENELVLKRESQSIRKDALLEQAGKISATIVRTARGTIDTGHQSRISGYWRSNTGILIQVETDHHTVHATWTWGSRSYDLTGIVMNRAIIINEINWSTNSLTAYSSRDSELKQSFGVYMPESDRIELIIEKGTSPEVWTLTRTEPVNDDSNTEGAHDI